MKSTSRRPFAWAALILTLAVLGAVLSAPYRGVRREAARAREALRRDGFKVELEEFARSADPAALARGRELDAAALELARRAAGDPEPMMQPLTNGVARARWWDRGTSSERGENPARERVIRTLSEGEPEFGIASEGATIPTVYLSHLRTCARDLADAAGECLAAGDRDGAGRAADALLALACRRVPEPVPAARNAAAQLQELAFATLWELLQTNGWTDARLAGWQRQWQSVRPREGLPECAAFARAWALTVLRRAREERSTSAGQFFGEIAAVAITSWDRPSVILERVAREWEGWREESRYLHVTSYREEVFLGRYYREREVDLRAAIQLPTWEAMRSRLAATLARLATAPDYRSCGSEEAAEAAARTAVPPGDSLLGLAMEAEARRGVALAALAVERHRLRHGEYPAALADLDPAIVTESPIDPMDGQPLRYRRVAPDRFVLHSIGLDGRDDGGGLVSDRRYGDSSTRNPDLVWPRPADARELAAWREAQARPWMNRFPTVSARARVVRGAPLPPELLRRFGLPPGTPGVGPGPVPGEAAPASGDESGRRRTDDGEAVDGRGEGVRRGRSGPVP